MNLKTCYLLDRDPTENDIREMLRWREIYDFEVQRIRRVLEHFDTHMLVKVRPLIKMKS